MPWTGYARFTWEFLSQTDEDCVRQFHLNDDTSPQHKLLTVRYTWEFEPREPRKSSLITARQKYTEHISEKYKMNQGVLVETSTEWALRNVDLYKEMTNKLKSMRQCHVRKVENADTPTKGENFGDTHVSEYNIKTDPKKTGPVCMAWIPQMNLIHGLPCNQKLFSDSVEWLTLLIILS